LATAVAERADLRVGATVRTLGKCKKSQRDQGYQKSPRDLRAQIQSRQRIKMHGMPMMFDRISVY
jgi:hypothetical protein